MVMGNIHEFMDEMLCAWIQNHMKIVGSALQSDEQLAMVRTSMVLDEGGHDHYVVE